MSGNSSSHAAAPDRNLPNGLRPLPPHPNLEFERKRAKARLRQMHRADPGARLASAQFGIAREYGFASWPKLVAYYATLERHERCVRLPLRYSPKDIDRLTQIVLTGHRDRDARAGQFLATFVPRFYGKTLAEVFARAVFIEDAQLVVARQSCLPSWEALLEHAQASPWEGVGGWHGSESPFARALKAVKAADLALLAPVIEAHPDLLRIPGPRERHRGDIVEHALIAEWHTQSAEARRVTDWLERRGANLRDTLNRSLLEFPQEGFIEFLLERGADPNWIPPNGISVLEHALMRCWSARKVDLIARRVIPKQAFWIAAGLGDVESLVRYFDRNGKLTHDARRDRPDFTAVTHPIPCLPDADDHEIMWEAFYVAAMNGRTKAMDALLDRGFPIDHAPHGETVLQCAIIRRLLLLVEYLVRRGARFRAGHGLGPGIDEWMYDHAPTDVGTRRMYELCGGKNADAVIRRWRLCGPQASTSE